MNNFHNLILPETKYLLCEWYEDWPQGTDTSLNRLSQKGVTRILKIAYYSKMNQVWIEYIDMSGSFNNKLHITPLPSIQLFQTLCPTWNRNKWFPLVKAYMQEHPNMFNQVNDSNKIWLMSQILGQ